MDIVIDKDHLVSRLRMLTFTHYELLGQPDGLRIRLEGPDGLTFVEVCGTMTPSERTALEATLQERVRPFSKNPR